MRKIGLLAVSILCLAYVAQASNIQYISTGDTFKYMCTASGVYCGSSSGFQNAGYDDSAWLTGPAPFGNVLTGDFGYQSGTFWDVNYDPFLRTTFTLVNPVDMLVQLGVDNGYAFYVNGMLVSSANAEGYTSRWEYSFNVDSSYFVSGTNVIAIALEDHGGLTAFDMQMTGDSSGIRPVPEPASMLLVGSGIAVFIRRRK